MGARPAEPPLVINADCRALSELGRGIVPGLAARGAAGEGTHGIRPFVQV
jgi:hypothetical protein